MNATTGDPSETGCTPGDSPCLRVHVIFTSLEETRLALSRAERLAAGLEAEIALILVRVVPFPLPLDQPPAAIDFAQAQVQSLAATVGVAVNGFVYLCRDPLRLLSSVLPPKALLVIGTGRGWAFSKSKRLTRALRRKGHHVIAADRLSDVKCQLSNVKY